jgi:hypothetical protein
MDNPESAAFSTPVPDDLPRETSAGEIPGMPKDSPQDVHEDSRNDSPVLDPSVPGALPAVSFPARAHVAASSVPSRRAALVATGLAALALLAWLVVQREGLLEASSPRETVRAQLDDLGRGQLRAAYDLFSPRYRQQVPFDLWRQLVVTHWRVFRTRELRFGDNQESGGRAVLETHLTAESGDRYVARFTLIRAQGRWWIDDLRWSQESDDRERIST